MNPRSRRRTNRHELLVGRGREQVWIDEVLADGLDGSGSVITITGPAGIGKSALAEWTSHRANASGMRSIRVAASAAHLEPSLGLWTRLGELASLRFGQPPHDPPHDFRAAAAMLHDLGNEPTLLILDDLHGADDASLALLAQVAGVVGSIPLVMVLSARDPAAHPASHGRDLLAGLVATSTHIPLDGIPSGDISTLVTAVAGQDSRRWAEQNASELNELSSGNPLAVIDLLEDLDVINGQRPDLNALEMSSGDTRRRRHLASVHRRLAAVAPETFEILTIAALSEAMADVGFLAKVCGQPVVAHLREAELAGIIHLSDSRVEFTQPTIAESIRESNPDRPDLHLRIVSALSTSELTADRQILLLRHLAAASAEGDTNEIERVARIAAAAARSLGDAASEAEALEHLARASTADRSDTLLRAAYAHHRSGSRARGWELAALAHAEATSDDQRVAAALAFAEGRDYAGGTRQAAQLIEGTLETIGPDHHRRAELLGALAELLRRREVTDGPVTPDSGVYNWVATVDDGIRQINAAIELTQSSATDPDVIRRLDLTWTRLHHNPDDHPERRRRLNNAIIGAGDQRLTGALAKAVLIEHLMAGDRAAADDALHELRTSALATGDLGLQWSWRTMNASVLIASGRPHDARDEMIAGFVAGERGGEPGRWVLRLTHEMTLAFETDDDPQAPDWSSALPEGALRHHLWDNGISWAIASTHPDQIRVDSIDRLMARLERDRSRTETWLLSATMIADIVWRARHHDAAAPLLELLLPYRSLVAIDENGHNCQGSVARPLSRLAQLLEQDELADDLGREGRDIDQNAGLDRFVFIDQLDTLEAHAPHGSRPGPEFTAHALELAAAAEERGLRRISRRARQLVDAGLSAGLTDRQRRVLEGLADGLTYAQISQRIGFSHSVVRKDAIEIYALLGVDGRNNAVALAHDLGII